MISEEFSQVREGRHVVQTTEGFEISKVGGGWIAEMFCDEDEYQGECPSVKFKNYGALKGKDDAEIDSALKIAIDLEIVG